MARSVLHQLAASAALLLANAAGPACQPAAASAAADGAERVATSCRGCVAAISAIASGKTAALGEQQLGCGVLWGSDGYVVVPYAPLTRLSRQGTAGDPQVFVTVTAADGSRQRLPADIVAKDPSHELIVLQVAPPDGGLRPAPLGASAGLRVGQDAYLLATQPDAELLVAAGKPQHAPQRRVISAVGRVIPASNNQAIGGILQTDAQVSAASLGGALVDSAGRLVGMPVVAYGKGPGHSSGVTFALPADLLREVVPRLIVYGSAAVRR
ncbi:hypothetical protein CHLNCDRAFT_137561 [Chlorella variabilis]|uniref:Serine protease n=1 Tax=Chlorella variabilis TaxID=554065 RepID=E1Z3Z1_CHLVA|nr:hypothetical protein CHLNCDRAFT_137561 [Chlorella variabilis]EFN58964.1 hypothetical protein CHLNCDRAFT_137561 [Chlorella variabilis]|eukprot:XP_005851066.1 hypothetical protein CHLNCDRAFT_137561 [Chlorella variabilis]